MVGDKSKADVQTRSSSKHPKKWDLPAALQRAQGGKVIKNLEGKKRVKKLGGGEKNIKPA